MECWQLQFNRVEEVCKLNISFKDKFYPEIKFNWLMRKKNGSKSWRKLQISIKQDKENYRETTPYLEQPGHYCL